MSANRIAVSWRAGWSSSAMRANMPWLPRVISETMLAGAAGRYRITQPTSSGSANVRQRVWAGGASGWR